MDFPTFFDLVTELETRASKIYESLAALCADDRLAGQLKTLATEEVNHANIVLRGKLFHQEMPDLFIGAAVEEGLIEKALEDAQKLLVSIGPGFSLSLGLKTMLELEKRFEKVHLDSSVKVKDPSLHDLFAGLTKSDQSHIEKLSRMIDGFPHQS